jgi:hypothetical protein
MRRILYGLAVSIAVPGLVAGLLSCSGQTSTAVIPELQLPPKPDPKGYVCYRTNEVIKPDGVIDEAAWQAAPWTDYFTDIEGSAKPAPKYRTRAKMLWDDQNLYIAAELEEPHVWATLRQRDTVIFYDNDFEVFIDPDGDTHAYYELEVNALGTAWDLLLLKPYRDGGLPVNGWDIAGLRVGTHVTGTINNPADTDQGWSVEIVYPLAALKECAPGARAPVAGDHWKIDFSRVQWRMKIENGNYRKEINPQTGKAYPEDNWVWSPQGRINMHMPEMWGALQFSSLVAGSGQEAFVPDADLNRKWALMMVYYAETAYFAANKIYTEDIKKLGLNPGDFPENQPLPVIKVTPTAYESSIPGADGKLTWTIFQDSRLVSNASFRPGQ